MRKKKRWAGEEGWVMKFHLCFVSFSTSFVVLLERRFSQVVCSPPQLRNSCSTNSECLQRSDVSAQRIVFVPSRCQCWLSRLISDLAHLLHGSSHSQSDWFALLFQSYLDVWKLLPGRSGYRHQRLGVGTRSVIVSTQLPPSSTFCSSHAVAQPHEHSDIAYWRRS